MPAAIPWDNDELQKLVSDPNYRVFVEQRKVPVSLQPFHLRDCKSAVRDLLNARVDKYDNSLKGILLCFKHLRVANKSAPVAAETSGLLLEVEAEFYIFRPEVGNVLKGIVNKISNDHVGVLLYHRFNVSCPRPSSEARSERWLGNKVTMHQEVVLKLKDTNFGGSIPFFKGKLLELGAIVKSQDGEGKKSKKKMDQTVENVVPEPTNTPTPKKRKNKLEETEVKPELQVKKSKKEERAGIIKPTSDSVGMPVPKTKGRISIGSTDEIGYNQRWSLDVSQFNDDDLPPPNADSTHFDLAKSYSNLSKAEKKKNKLNNLGLSAIKEESSGGVKGASLADSNMDLTAKSQKSGVKKEKKKKKEKVKDEMKSSEPVVKEKKHKHKKEHVIEEPSKKEKRKVLDGNSAAVGLKHVRTVDVPKDDQGPPLKKEKKSKKEKSAAIPTQIEVSSKTQNDLTKWKDPQTPSKSNKKLKEKSPDTTVPLSVVMKGKSSMETLSLSKLKGEEKNLSPSKHQKKKKGVDVVDVPTNDTIASDDTIPPGQRVMRESPLKQPQKRSSLSVSFGITPEVSFFAAGDSLMGLGSRKGIKPTPLVMRNIEGKVLPHLESPLKLSPVKKRKCDSDSDVPSPKKGKKELKTSLMKKNVKQDSDSDSDSQAPKKVVVSSLHEMSSDSDEYEAPQSNNVRQTGEDSDDSDNATSVGKSQLLQAMGVMQSPLKTAKPGVKQDSSESDSDEGIRAKPLPVQNKVPNSSSSNAKTKKEKLPTNSKVAAKALPSTQVPQASKPTKQAKGKNSLPVAPAADDSDSDFDIEAVKRALIAAASQPKKQKESGKKQAVVATSKPEAPTKPAVAANLSSSDSESDSGPDDRNTTVLMSQMREQKVNESKSKKTQPAAKPIKIKTDSKAGGESEVKDSKGDAPKRKYTKKSDISKLSTVGTGDNQASAPPAKRKYTKKNTVNAVVAGDNPPAKRKYVRKNVSNAGIAASDDKQKSVPAPKRKYTKKSDIPKVEESEKKQKSKSQKVTDSDISDVMQRLLEQAKLRVGIS